METIDFVAFILLLADFAILYHLANCVSQIISFFMLLKFL